MKFKLTAIPFIFGCLMATLFTLNWEAFFAMAFAVITFATTKNIDWY